MLFFLIQLALVKSMYYLESRQSYITERTEGTITHAYEKKSKRSKTPYEYDYRFTYTYDGKDYDGQSVAKPPKLYNEGDKVTVWLDTSNPAVAQLFGTTNVLETPTVRWVFLVVAAVFFAFCVRFARTRVRELYKMRVSLLKVEEKKGRKRIQTRFDSKSNTWTGNMVFVVIKLTAVRVILLLFVVTLTIQN
jgi:hypothetical protein